MPVPPDPRDAEIKRLRKRLRRAERQLAAAHADPAAGMTADQIRHLHSLFTPSQPDRPCATCGKVHPGPCESCGGIHARKCPRVREVEYERHGDQVLIKRVRFWRKWDATGVLYPDDLPAIPEETA